MVPGGVDWLYAHIDIYIYIYIYIFMYIDIRVFVCLLLCLIVSLFVFEGVIPVFVQVHMDKCSTSFIPPKKTHPVQLSDQFTGQVLVDRLNAAGMKLEVEP